MENQKGLGVIAHVLGLFTAFLGPLILYFFIEDDKPFAKEHVKEALNFQFSLVIGLIISAILSIIIVGIFVFISLVILNIIWSIMGALAANEQREYKYPVSFKFIK